MCTSVAHQTACCSCHTYATDVEPLHNTASAMLKKQMLPSSDKRPRFSFIHQWLYSPLLGPGLFFSFVIFFTQLIGLLGRVVSPSPGRYLHNRTTQTQNKRTQTHPCLEWDSKPRSSVRASEDSSCLRPCAHCDRQPCFYVGYLRNLIPCQGRKPCDNNERRFFEHNFTLCLQGTKIVSITRKIARLLFHQILIFRA
jgi:hypothetical protein